MILSSTAGCSRHPARVRGHDGILPDLPAPPALHRRADAHEPHLPTPDAVAAGFRAAVGTAVPLQSGPGAGHRPSDPGRRRDPG